MMSGGELLSVDGYVRVSQVGRRGGQQFISPQVQREAIEGWAAMRGARVLEVFEELDESGGRGDRPLLETALQRVESGSSEKGRGGLMTAGTSSARSRRSRIVPVLVAVLV